MGGGLSLCGRFRARGKEGSEASVASGTPAVGVFWQRTKWRRWAQPTLRKQPLDGVDELVHCEGLADVVVDPEHFSVRFVPRAFVGRDHDHANGNFAGAAKLFEDEKAGPLGHHHVEDDEIRVLALGHGQALIAVASDKNLKTL